MSATAAAPARAANRAAAPRPRESRTRTADRQRRAAPGTPGKRATPRTTVSWRSSGLEAERAVHARAYPPNRISPRNEIARGPELRAAQHRRIHEHGMPRRARSPHPLLLGEVTDRDEIEPALRVAA